MNFGVLIPAYAQDVVKTDAAGYGFLMAASGIGSLLAALSLVFAGRPRPSRIATGAIILGVALTLLAGTQVMPIALVLMLLTGFGSIFMAATGNTTIQTAVPDQLRGRVMSVYTTVFSASVPIGGITMGAVASAFGISLAIAVGGILTVLVGIGAWVWGRRGAFAMPATAPAPAPSGGVVIAGARPR